MSWLRSQIALHPGRASLYGDLGAASLAVGDIKAAAVGFLRCLRLDPSQHRAAAELGQIFRGAGHLDIALGYLRAALVAEPQSSGLYGKIASCQEELGWPEEAGWHFTRAALVDRIGPVPAMGLVMSALYRPGVRLADIGKAAQEVASRLGPPAAGRSPRPDEADRPLSLGFLSADFRKHPVGHLVLPAFEGLARLGSSLTCYSMHRRTDAMTERFKTSAHRWRDVHSLSDDALAAQIEADGIDILIDLAGFTGGERVVMLNRRPAPLQLGWAGFPATTGLSSIDYLIADWHQVPLSAEPYYTEKILRLPHSYVVFGPPAECGLVPLPAERNGFVTFACFNAAKKINEAVIAVWSRLLRRLPTARLVLKAEAFSLKGGPDARFRDLFSSHGIDPERVAFLGSTSREDHLAAMGCADIALDPFPYSGGQTTLELLWSGLPIVSLPGETWASRHTAGYLTTLGLTELLAVDEEDYIAKAQALAEDYGRLNQLRLTLRECLVNSPLCDVAGFTRDFDKALREIWTRKCAGQ
jgi:predicted O-linked N-acetylglucosamine transferase (SPINDLY family)